MENNPAFPATRWSLIDKLSDPEESTAALAMEEICALYRFPLYAYIRASGLSHHDAEDALQDFFASLLRRRSLHDVESKKGRLRVYLLVLLKRHLIDRHRAESASSRKGLPPELADHTGFEERYLKYSSGANLHPDVLLDQIWGREILARVLGKLAANYAAKGKTELFEKLRPVLDAGGSLREDDSAAMARDLGLSRDALRVALYRLMERFRDVLWQEIRQTVAHPDDVQQEMMYLRTVFSPPP